MQVVQGALLTPACSTRHAHLPTLPAPLALPAAGCVTIAGLLFHWFSPSGVDCSLNVSIVALSLILCIILSLLTMHPTVSGAAPLVRSWRQQPCAALGRAGCATEAEQGRGAGAAKCSGRQAGSAAAFRGHRGRFTRQSALPSTHSCSHASCLCCTPPTSAGAARQPVPCCLHLSVHNVPGLQRAAV